MLTDGCRKPRAVGNRPMRGFMRLAATCALLAGTAFAGASTDSPPAQIHEIIAKFASKEAQFALARGNYTYRQTARVMSLDSDGTPTGKWEEVSDIVFTPQGKRAEQ